MVNAFEIWTLLIISAQQGNSWYLFGKPWVYWSRFKRAWKAGKYRKKLLYSESRESVAVEEARTRGKNQMVRSIFRAVQKSKAVQNDHCN